MRKYEKFTDEHLNTLSQDPQNLVYRYNSRDELPEEEIVPVEEVLSKVKRLYAEYCAKRNVYIQQNKAVKKKDWLRMKEELLCDPEWKRFDYTHPLIFDRVISPDTTEKEIKHIVFLIILKMRTNAGNRTPQQAQEEAIKYLTEQFSMSKEEWNEKNKGLVQEKFSH